MAMPNAMSWGFCVPAFAAPGPALFRTPGFLTIDPDAAVALALEAEALGFDAVWVPDHLMLGCDDAILEGWTTLAFLAGQTRRVRLGLIHQLDPLRHPAWTAKMVATLDQLSHGRVIYFPDWARRAEELQAYGFVVPSPEERAHRLGESLALTRALWTANERVWWTGRFFHVRDARVSPLPLQKPHPPIWLGQDDPLTLDLTARYADGWNFVMGSGDLDGALGRLKEALAAASRSLTELVLSVEVQVLIRETENEARSALAALARRSATSLTSKDVEALRRDWLFGTPEAVVSRQIDGLGRRGIRHLLLWFVDLPDVTGLRLFAETMLPRFRSPSASSGEWVRRDP
jgi:alkanesulfonate monooxygenase SsuD/methylene tetrahydromethanopterin reductase-like flavin-dependent oxidoreductase (luciferase family)